MHESSSMTTANAIIRIDNEIIDGQRLSGRWQDSAVVSDQAGCSTTTAVRPTRRLSRRSIYGTFRGCRQHIGHVLGDSSQTA